METETNQAPPQLKKKNRNWIYPQTRMQKPETIQIFQYHNA